MFDLEKVLKSTKNASVNLLDYSEKEINKALINCAKNLIKDKVLLKSANKIDVDNAKNAGKSEAFIDRLVLTDELIQSMAQSLIDISKLKSPAGEVLYRYKNAKQGIMIEKKAVPFGVIGIIYEARPNVTVDAFGLAFKTKNCIILKGGSDAINSNIAIEEALKTALIECGVDSNVINVIHATDRETTQEFMKMDKYVDLLIPRGSFNLIKNAVENSTIPIIETGTGNCHVYIDEFADIDKAVEIVYNAKTQRYGVCNALESIVIHKNVLNEILPLIERKLKEKQVEIRADEKAIKVLESGVPAKEEDFFAEYLGPVISVKTVSDIYEAIDHINLTGTKHSESIITEDQDNAQLFMEKVDASAVYHNASTRFTDGFVFGLSAEMGISTQKLHARGPMGLDALMTTKYYVEDLTKSGAIRK